MISLPRCVQGFAANPAFEIILHRGHPRHERRDPLAYLRCLHWERGSRRCPRAFGWRRSDGLDDALLVLRIAAVGHRRLSITAAERGNGGMKSS